MGASLALAGVSACTRQPAETIVPYVRAPEEIVPGRPLFFATAVTLGGYATGVLVESHEGRPTKIEGNPEHPASLGATDIFAQASILGLYDPDRSQALTHAGDIRTWSAFLGALRARRRAEARGAGRGSPAADRDGDLADPGAPDRASSSRSSRRPGGTSTSRPAATRRGPARTRRSARTSTRGTSSTRRTIVVSLDADFLGTMPGSVRYIRDFASGRRVRGADAGMSRFYAAESAPTTPAPRPITAWPCEAERDGAGGPRPGVGRRRAWRAADGRPRVGAHVCRRRRPRPDGQQGRVDRRRRRRAAGRRARARPRHQPAPRQRRRHRRLHRPGRARRRSTRSSRSGTSSPTCTAGNGRRAADSRRQPGVHGAWRISQFGDALGEGGLQRPSRALRGRDLGEVPVARARSARARGLERRARLGRHRDHHAAADRAALRRQVGARRARRALEDAGPLGVRRRARHVEGRRCAGAAPLDRRGLLAQGRARRRRRRQRVRAEGVRAWATSSRPSARRRRPRPGLEVTFRAPIRRSTTAASRTSAGSRSCRSRSRS